MRALKKNCRTVRVIDDAKEARKFIEWLRKRKNGIPFAIDFETTGLSADTAQVRLSCISCRKNEAFVIDHFACGSFASFADDLAMLGPWYVFSLNFEGMWFDHEVRDADPVELLDVGHMRRSVQGGGPLKLSTMVKWDLGIDMSKELQNSDWSNPNLTDEQYFYGGLDAIYTRDLGVLWKSKMSAEQESGFHVINDSWRAVSECSATGMLVDEIYYEGLIKMWEKRREAAEKAIRKLVPESAIANLRSKKQISDFLKSVLDDAAIDSWPATDKTHQLQTSRDILRQMSFLAPYPFSRFLAGLMVFNRADKYISSFGETILTKQRLSPDGRAHPRFNIAQAVTGRMSSSNYNAQQLPNSPVVRKGFIAGNGYKLVIADYSGVEVRVLAELSGDQILLHDAIYGDVHSQSAIAIYKLNEEDFLARIEEKDTRAKGMRGKAKGFTFQLCLAEGTMILTDSGLVPIEDVQLHHKLWDGVEFVSHSGVVYNGIQEVIEHDGIEATPDHEVYCEDGTVEPLYAAMYRGARLLQTGEPVKPKNTGRDKKKVYDIVDAGPRHRYTANGRLVHNCYGAGPPALSITLRSSVSHAEDAVKAWSDRYSKAYNYRFYMQEKMNHTGYIETKSGRTIYVPKRDRSLPVAANYPIQGSAGDVMYRALYHTHRLLEEADIDAYLIAPVHDELLILAHESVAEEAKEIIEEGMKQGWLDIFPDTNLDNLVEGAIGDNWADKA